jgi:antitoxin FitA
MAVVNIRNLPDEVRDRLRVRAAKAGRSMEAEARAILAAACAEETDRSPGELAQWVERLYLGKKPSGVVADLIAERRREARREQRPERSRRRQRK